MTRHPAHLVLLAILASTGACASRYEVATNAPAYAGMAKIAVSVNKTDNRVVKLRIDHLAPADRIAGDLVGYVVWFAVPGLGVTRAGMLDYDRKHRRGRLVATTPNPKFEVIVTLESNPSVSAPGERVVLRQLVGKS